MGLGEVKGGWSTCLCEVKGGRSMWLGEVKDAPRPNGSLATISRPAVHVPRRELIKWNIYESFLAILPQAWWREVNCGSFPP